MLLISLDNQVLTTLHFGTPEFDQRVPDSKSEWILRYENLRKKYPPIDYSDGGVVNKEEVEQVFETMRNSQNGNKSDN